MTLVIYNEPIIYELIKIGFICIDISNIFCHEQICTIEYFTPNYFSAKGIIFLFTWYLARTTYEVEHPWSISSHGELLEVISSNFTMFLSTQCYPTCDQRGVVSAV